MCVTSAKNIWIQKLFLHVHCFLRFDRASVRFLFWAALGSYKRGFVKIQRSIWKHLEHQNSCYGGTKKLKKFL